MPATLAELPALPVWHSVLVLSPAAVLALGAIGCALPRDRQTVWRLAARATDAAWLLSLLGLLALCWRGPGLAALWRADLLGGVTALLVAFVGWIIVRYSRSYLDGEPHERRYAQALLAALASVLLVVASNNLLLTTLAWTASSIALHRLLTFYRERPAAVLAAHKKWLLARVADACMLGACALLHAAFGTLRIDELLALTTGSTAPPITAQVAVLLIVLAALLKCAQLPFHGWLIQVMEAPTPVSALLHAGVVNLGGFVLIRLAPLVAQVPPAMTLLVLAGGATAVLAALVMTTRISVKVMLAWSTCAQMGFMLMQCGLGLWEMALLHLVAHSLYKAHAFLGAGWTVRQTSVRRLAVPAAPRSVGAVTAGVLIAVALAAAVVFASGLQHAMPAALWVMAGIVALALTPLTVRDAGSATRSRLPSVLVAAALILVYFALHALLQPWVAPAAVPPASGAWLFVAVAFVLLFALQTLIALRPRHRLAQRLYPWCYGGLFLDERFSRLLLRRWPPPPRAPGRLGDAAWQAAQSN